MPDARDARAHYHIPGEGFSGENASASHRTTSATINGNAGAARQFTASADFVSGPLDPGVWEATFTNNTLASGILTAIIMSQGADATEAAAASATSAVAPVKGAVSTAAPIAEVLRFIVPKGRQYVWFIAGSTATINLSLRKLHGLP